MMSGIYSPNVLMKDSTNDCLVQTALYVYCLYTQGIYFNSQWEEGKWGKKLPALAF